MIYGTYVLYYMDIIYAGIDDANSKETVVTPEVYRNLTSKSQKFDAVLMSKSGNYNILSYHVPGVNVFIDSRYAGLPLEKNVEDMVKLFIPKPVTDAIEGGTFQLMSELRNVTTMFFKLDSYHPDTHKNPISLQKFCYMAQRAISEAGGYFRQFLVDDKGCVLIAMWGVPSFSYTNNNDRAVSCAYALRKGTASIGHACSVGIATGLVYCGNIGSSSRRDFVAIGDRVNLAARLMSKANGTIFVSEATTNLLSSVWSKRMQKTEEMMLKGCGMIHAYALKGDVAMNKLDAKNDKCLFLQRKIVTVLTTEIDKVVKKEPQCSLYRKDVTKLIKQLLLLRVSLVVVKAQWQSMPTFTQESVPVMLYTFSSVQMTNLLYGRCLAEY